MQHRRRNSILYLSSASGVLTCNDARGQLLLFETPNVLGSTWQTHSTVQ